MKSLRRLGRTPAGTRLLADDVLEFHAARLLLLLNLCGTANRIDGLTKLAKLDFFVRYPQFFEQIVGGHSRVTSTESSMVRFHYGPWDRRYYHVLAFLEAGGLIRISNFKGAVRVELTENGKTLAAVLSSTPAYRTIAAQMSKVKKAVGSKSGSALKKLIYQMFDAEVGQLELGDMIR